MKKLHLLKIYTLTLLTGLTLFACSKDKATDVEPQTIMTAKDINGVWSYSENSFLYTLKEDLQFIDLFNEPWQGTFQIDNVNVLTSDLKFFYDNAFRDAHLFSSKVSIIIYNDLFRIDYQNESYVFNSSFSFSTTSGLFKATGIASNGTNKQISVNMDLYIPAKKVTKGVEFKVPDGLYFEKRPFTEITFGDDKSLKTTVMDIDMIYDNNGVWKVENDTIGMTFEQRNYMQSFKYQFTSDKKLALINDVIIENAADYNTIPGSMISKLQYQRLFIKKTE